MRFEVEILVTVERYRSAVELLQSALRETVALSGKIPLSGAGFLGAEF